MKCFGKKENKIKNRSYRTRDLAHPPSRATTQSNNSKYSLYTGGVVIVVAIPPLVHYSSRHDIIITYIGSTPCTHRCPHVSACVGSAARVHNNALCTGYCYYYYYSHRCIRTPRHVITDSPFVRPHILFFSVAVRISARARPGHTTPRVSPAYIPVRVPRSAW